MKKAFLGIVVGLLAGGAGVWTFLHHRHAGEPDAKKEEKKEESRVQHGTNGETFLKLDKEAQERVGLKTAVLEAAELKPELKAFGRVLDPASLAAGVQEMLAAEVQLDASKKEAERLKALHEQNQNVSTRALEMAQAAVARDQIARNAAQLRFTTTWGPAITSIKDLERLVLELAARRTSLVRVDVPASDKLDGAPTGARLALLSAPDAPMATEFLGEAVSADPQTLGRGFFFLVKGKSLAANTAVIAWLSLPGEPEKGIIVPRDAIVRHEGEAFIYLQTGEKTFERREIELERPLEKGWFTEELKPGMNVVTTGAQQLFSEELKGEGGGE